MLQIEGLKTYFYTSDGIIPAVDGVSLSIKDKEIVGLVGESGSGKSVTALSILKLLPMPPARIVGGKVLFEGNDIVKLPMNEMQRFRGKEISMIFQEPMSSLNPVITVGDQVSEVIRNHHRLNKRQSMVKAAEVLKMVGISEPKRRIHEYPHQLSGGIRQRIMIAIALSCNPKILIADEPTTALDVTIQAQIIDLMKELREQLNMAIMMITHDLAVVAGMVERVIVMYSGVIVEEVPVEDLFRDPLHPYTVGLLKSIPRMDVSLKRLNVIKGAVPNPIIGKMPVGCRFAPRCPEAFKRCGIERPIMVDMGGGRRVKCFLYNC